LSCATIPSAFFFRAALVPGHDDEDPTDLEDLGLPEQGGIGGIEGRDLVLAGHGSILGGLRKKRSDGLLCPHLGLERVLVEPLGGESSLPLLLVPNCRPRSVGGALDLLCARRDSPGHCLLDEQLPDDVLVHGLANGPRNCGIVLLLPSHCLRSERQH
jgi:hypothetical protein